MSMKLSDPQEINDKLYRFTNIHEALPSPNAVQAEHYATYKQQGFLAVEQVIAPQLIEQAIEALEEIIYDDDTKVKVQFSKPKAEIHSKEERMLSVRKVYEYVEHEQRLKAIAESPELMKIVETILGEKARMIQDMALLKPPHGGGEKPWHQDMAYGPLTYDKPVLGIWIALDEAGVDNGCMHVVPRSHMDGGIPHYAVRDWQVCDTNVPVERDVVCPLKPGGTLFFHGMLMHGTPYNFSTKRRRALQFHFVGESATRVTPGEYKRMFTNEMTGAEC